jgi:hypothetical protein
MLRPVYFTSGKGSVLIVQEGGWAPGPVWTGAENLAPHLDSVPGQPVASRYTDWAIAAHNSQYITIENRLT